MSLTSDVRIGIAIGMPLAVQALDVGDGVKEPVRTRMPAHLYVQGGVQLWRVRWAGDG